MSAPNATLRRWVMTLGVTAITVSGAYLGANLGVERDRQKDKQKAQEADLGKQVEQLEMYRVRLMKQRKELQNKLDEVSKRPKE